jgi:hypothetical protein
MRKKALIYSLKVWGVSIIVSPVVYYAWTKNYSEAFEPGNFFGFWAFSLIYGLVLSLPCYILFLFANYYVGSRNWSDLGKKMGLGVWGTLLILALIYLIFGHDDNIFLPSTIKMAVSYILSANFALIFFALPKRSPALRQVKPNN